jgi:hypothetical protein
LAVQDRGSPEARSSADIARKEGELRDLLYSLVPQDSNTISSVPLVIEFKPDMSYYCLKNVSVRRVDQEQYEQSKVVEVYREEVAQSQSLAAIHYNPEDILERMKFRPVEEVPAGDSNSPAEKEGG